MKKGMFLGICVLFCALSVSAQQSNGVGTNAWFKGPVGLQMYSLRDVTKGNVEEGIRLASQMGFKYVEASNTFGLTIEQYQELLQKYGLTSPVGGSTYGEIQTEEGLEKAIHKAKTLGAKYVRIAWIDHKRPFDEAAARKAIAVFNKAGKRLAEEGLMFAYHNHGYEFVPYKDGTLMDLILQETDPRYVTFEMDVLWTIFPGADPVALLKKYPNRWKLMHLKDLKKGVVGNLTGGTSTDNDVAIGTGQADYSAILRTAQETGVEYYFIEDESPRFRTQILESLRNLEAMKN
ncbi:MAG: sugar phosphate isomerase/epimerase [Planctomycetia bacterium]|nr:sugar phosphate isomerase/epimerase [Planctomycetia bacterium]